MLYDLIMSRLMPMFNQNAGNAEKISQIILTLAKVSELNWRGICFSVFQDTLSEPKILSIT